MKDLVFKIQNQFLDFDSSIINNATTARKAEHDSRFIFIIGAPRTGSTVLYQSMLTQFKLGYLTNLMYLFPSKIALITQLTKAKILSNKDIKDSDLGFIKGFNSPSECGRLFRFWFDEGDFCIKSENIQKTFNFLSEAFQCPLLVKNMLNAYRIEKLKMLFPSSKFIFIRRDPLYTCQSILLSRKQLHNTYNKWWSITPPGYTEVLSETPFVQVAWQVSSIEMAIKDSMRGDPSVIPVQYEEFCDSPQQELDKLGDNLKLKSKQAALNNNVIAKKNIKILNNKEWRELKSAVEMFYS